MISSTEEKMIPNEPKIQSIKHTRALTQPSKNDISKSSSKAQNLTILTCDDDLFQKTFFTSLINQLKKSTPGLNICFYSFMTGEDLLDFYIRRKRQDVPKGPMIIITDYNMGLNCQDGVIIARKLRLHNFRGPIMLRTSDEWNEIKAKHPGVEDFITEFSSKEQCHECLKSLKHLVMKNFKD